MNTKICYGYNNDNVYSGTELAFEDPMEEGNYPLPANATFVEPPELEAPYVNVWDGTQWVATEDHRRHLDDTGTPAGGTPYWLPSEGDNWQSEPRYMDALGPLPEGAVTTRPEKTVEEIQKEELQTLIYESQQTLENTDYRVIKFMDKYIQTHPEALAEFEAEYPDTLEKRQDARDAINGAQAQAETAGINLS